MALNQGSVRIIGGEWRRRIITFPLCVDLRPTPDRVRETVFNWLGQDLNGKICLDLFAGSGAMGFEAASRGAKQVVMVESSRAVLQALRRNAENLQATQVELVGMDAMAYIASNSKQFDIVFLDPPYRLNLLPELLALFVSQLAIGSRVYIESKERLCCDQHWDVLRSKKAGRVCYQLLALRENG